MLSYTAGYLLDVPSPYRMSYPQGRTAAPPPSTAAPAPESRPRPPVAPQACWPGTRCPRSVTAASQSAEIQRCGQNRSITVIRTTMYI